MPAHNFLLVNGSFYVKAAEITVETNIVLIRWKMAGYTDREEGSKKNAFSCQVILLRYVLYMTEHMDAVQEVIVNLKRRGDDTGQ